MVSPPEMDENKRTAYQVGLSHAKAVRDVALEGTCAAGLLQAPIGVPLPS